MSEKLVVAAGEVNSGQGLTTSDKAQERGPRPSEGFHLLGEPMTHELTQGLSFCSGHSLSQYTSKKWHCDRR